LQKSVEYRRLAKTRQARNFYFSVLPGIFQREPADYGLLVPKSDGDGIVIAGVVVSIGAPALSCFRTSSVRSFSLAW
jgi:hypothetical protein